MSEKRSEHGLGTFALLLVAVFLNTPKCDHSFSEWWTGSEGTDYRWCTACGEEEARKHPALVADKVVFADGFEVGGTAEGIVLPEKP